MMIDKFSYTHLESCSQVKNQKITAQKGKKGEELSPTLAQMI